MMGWHSAARKKTISPTQRHCSKLQNYLGGSHNVIAIRAYIFFWLPDTSPTSSDTVICTRAALKPNSVEKLMFQQLPTGS